MLNKLIDIFLDTGLYEIKIDNDEYGNTYNSIDYTGDYEYDPYLTYDDSMINYVQIDFNNKYITLHDYNSDDLLCIEIQEIKNVNKEIEEGEEVYIIELVSGDEVYITY